MSRHGVSRRVSRGRVLRGPRALACLTPLRLGSYRLHKVETSATGSAGYYWYRLYTGFQQREANTRGMRGAAKPG